MANGLIYDGTWNGILDKQFPSTWKLNDPSYSLGADSKYDESTLLYISRREYLHFNYRYKCNTLNIFNRQRQFNTLRIDINCDHNLIYSIRCFLKLYTYYTFFTLKI